MGLTPLPLDPDLKAMLPDQLNLGPGKIGGMSPLPPTVNTVGMMPPAMGMLKSMFDGQSAPPPVDVSGMSAGAAPATPMLKPLSVVNGSPTGLLEQHNDAIIAKHNMPHPSQPGFFHKLGHILAQVGNVAGDIAAPGTMALIPGTGLNNELQYDRAVRENAGLHAQDMQEQDAASRRSLEGAQAAQEAEATREMPGKTAAEEALQSAQAYRAIHPLATSAFDLWLQQNPTGTAQDYNNMMAHPLSQEQADSMNKIWDPIAQKNGLPLGQFKAGTPAADANVLSASLNNVISRGQGAQRVTIEQQVADQKVPMLAPDGKGGFTLQYVQPGQTITPGSMTPTQGGGVNAPTTTEKNAGAQGQLVHEQIPMLLKEIDQNASQMGPILGHWNEFMQGKIGLDNPQYAELRANLMMAASAVALAHARGRLPENLREEFDKMINAPQQSPANLKATLQAIDPWMVKMGDMGQVQGLSRNGGSGGGESGKSFSLKQAMGLPFNKGKSEADVRSDLQKHGYTVTE